MHRRSFLAGTLAFLAGPLAAKAQQAILPPVSLVLTLEVHDQDAWLGMLHEILTTPQESQKTLVVTISAQAGSSRTIAILTPKFTSTINSTTGTIARVSVKGRVAGEHAQQTLVPFMRAFGESTAGRDPSQVMVEYGLAALTANLWS